MALPWERPSANTRRTGTRAIARGCESPSLRCRYGQTRRRRRASSLTPPAPPAPQENGTKSPAPLAELVTRHEGKTALVTTDGRIWSEVAGQTVNAKIRIEMLWLKRVDTDGVSSLLDGGVMGAAMCIVRTKVGTRGVAAVKVSMSTAEDGHVESVVLPASDGVRPDRLFRPSVWCHPPDAAGRHGAAPEVEEAQEARGGEGMSEIVVVDCVTYAIKRIKEEEHRLKILDCAVMAIVGQYRMTSRNESGSKSMAEPVYEVLVEVKTNPNGHGTKFVEDAKRLDDRFVNQYSRIVLPVDIRLSDLKTPTHFAERLGSYWPPLGMTLTRSFTIGHLRDIFQDLNQRYLARGGVILRGIENFGLQYNTTDTIFCFSNLAINVSTGQVCDHIDVGFKLIPDVLSQADLSTNFYPVVCPVEDPVLRLRFYRTLVQQLIKKFTGVNFETTMLLMAVYAAAPQFEKIQAQMSGFFISVLTSQEGSTGKTEVIKMMNSIFGMPNKAMCASAS